MCHLVSYWYHFWLSLVVGIVMLPDKFGRLSTKRKTYYCWRWHVDASWCLEVELRGVQVVIAILNFTSAYFSFCCCCGLWWWLRVWRWQSMFRFGILVLLLGNASILWIPFWSNIAPKNQETSTCFFTRPGDDEGWTFGKKNAYQLRTQTPPKVVCNAQLPQWHWLEISLVVSESFQSVWISSQLFKGCFGVKFWTTFLDTQQKFEPKASCFKNQQRMFNKNRTCGVFKVPGFEGSQNAVWKVIHGCVSYGFVSICMLAYII